MKQILFACLSLAVFTTSSYAAIKVEVSTDRESAIYKVGEAVSFTISARDGNQSLDWGNLSWVLSMDGYGQISKGSGSLESGAVTVEGSLDRPGFLLLAVTFSGPDAQKASGFGSAAVSPKAISPSMPVPDDFDAFWSQQKANLAKVPITFELTPVAGQSSSEIDVSDVQIQCDPDGKPVSGYYAKPGEAKPKSHAAVLWVHGAGVRSSSLGAAIGGARDGLLSMDINAHGIANDRPTEFYNELKTGALKDYRKAGNDNRETIYFRGMFLRLVRAIDFLTSRPEWDGKTLAVIGHSQGGYQALVAGGLDSRVTFIGSGVPAGCDHTGMKANRISGWPKIVTVDPKSGPVPAELNASRYVDAVNFASRYEGEAILSVGFIDRVCPPTSIYAAYNVLRGKKQMIDVPKMGHAAPADIKNQFRGALLKHVAESQAVGVELR